MAEAIASSYDEKQSSSESTTDTGSSKENSPDPDSSSATDSDSSDDEYPPGPDSSSTASASGKSVKLGYAYEVKWLKRNKKISRQERRRIQQEILKGRKPALTVKNVIRALPGIVSDRLRKVLYIPNTKYEEIKNEFTTEDHCREALVQFWLLTDPLASWRRIVDRLYYMRDDLHTIADRIRHYAEELTDETHTHRNVSTVLNTVKVDRLESCLDIPFSVREKISGDEQQQRDECIHYWIHLSPYTSWTYLAGQLHLLGDTAAVEAVKRYFQRAPEPTLSLDTLTSVMNGVQGIDSVAIWLQIPASKRVEIKQQYASGPLRKRAYMEYWVAHHPAPSWKMIAISLWGSEELGALEVVQKLYFKGTSESRRLFEVSMKRGSIDAYIDKMLFYGSAGVGKTCTQKIIAKEDPPVVRSSTPLACRPVTLYQLQATKEVWSKYASEERMKLCARISKSVLGKEVVEAMVSSTSKVEDVSHPTVTASKDSVTDEKGDIDQGQLSATKSTEQHRDHPSPKVHPLVPRTRSVVDPEVIKVIHDVLERLFQLIDECPETEEPLKFLHKLPLVDCGGQPQFHEILPIFLRKMSMIIFVIKLSEELSSRPSIEYFEDGKSLGGRYESDHTTEQLVHQGLQSLHSHRSNKVNGDDPPPQIVVVGTHKDEEEKCKESREAKNSRLKEILLPTFEKEIVYHRHRTGEVIFPMNAKDPGSEEEVIATTIRSLISSKRRLNPRKLPLQWLTIEIILEEITQALQRGILSWSECLEVAHRLHLDKSMLEAALTYLDELSLLFYYPDILPELVFTNPQVVLDKISELVKVHHGIMECSPDHVDREAWLEFYNNALVTVKFLSQDIFKEHYVPGLFQPEHIVTLYRKLLIFAEYSKDKFFVPSLLRMLCNEEVAKKRLPQDSIVSPLVLYFPDGRPCRGIFCALVAFLTSPENHFPCPWKLKMPARSVTPSCLHRNCIQFTIPGVKTPCTLTLINTLLHFEVHLQVMSKEAAGKLCYMIKQAINAGLLKASITLRYAYSTPSFTLLCPCGKGEPHHAFIGEGFWICSMDEGRGDKFSQNQLIWLEEGTATDSPTGLEIPPPKKRKTCHSLEDIKYVGEKNIMPKPDITQREGLKTSTASKTASQATVGGTDSTKLAVRPRLHELDLKKGNGKTIKLINRTAADWERLATRFYFEGYEIRSLRTNHRETFEACREMFIEWLEGKGRSPKTWETVIIALEEADLSEIALDLKDVLGV